MLFTDGHAADPHIAKAATKRMKSRGDHVMTVGFGPKPSIERFKGELQAMSSNQKKDVFLKGFDDEDNIVRRLVETSLPKSKWTYLTTVTPCWVVMYCGRPRKHPATFERNVLLVKTFATILVMPPQLVNRRLKIVGIICNKCRCS